MSDNNRSINILVAEDNVVSRGLIVATLKTAGYTIYEATDGTEAIDIATSKTIDCAFVDINMEPKGGFAFIKHMLVENIKIPTVIITADTSGDTLAQSNELGVRRLLQKPVDPQLLLKITRQILEKHGHKHAIAVATHTSEALSHDDLMGRAVELAAHNKTSGKGRPFGAVVVDAKGHIIGKGTNGISSRVDPTAHAEVMAIRQAAEYLGRADLSDCALFCSSMPTLMGQALIASVCIPHVYYAFSHNDVGSGRETSDQQQPAIYMHMPRDDAHELFD